MVSDAKTLEAFGVTPEFQSALRFAVVSDSFSDPSPASRVAFQSALRFAVVSDLARSRTMRAPLNSFNPL